MANEMNYTGQNKGCREKPTSRVVTDDYRNNWDRIFNRPPINRINPDDAKKK